jgi:hypothetical protein
VVTSTAATAAIMLRRTFMAISYLNLADPCGVGHTTRGPIIAAARGLSRILGFPAGSAAALR